MTIKTRLQDDMKAAMRGREQARLTTIRLVLAAIKQREIDERTELDDAEVLAVLDKLAKQRRESIAQFRAAERSDLADKEAFELDIIQGYLPAALGPAELGRLIEEALAGTGAASIRDMGKVMARLRPQLQGRADMAEVSDRVKARLNA
jgi:uncharacterized protein YqeY